MNTRSMRTRSQVDAEEGGNVAATKKTTAEQTVPPADNDRPAKKSKPKSSSTSARDQLPHLLTQLNGGKPLDLAVISAINAAEPSNGGDGDDTSAKNPHDETLITKLFADHVGKSPEVIIGNAIRLSQEEMNREGFIFNKRQNGTEYGNEREQMVNHPMNKRIVGPTPDGKVLLELILGKDRANELLEGAVPFNPDRGTEQNVGTQPMEVIVFRSIENEASKLSISELMFNILTYTRDGVSNMSSLKELLRFSVVYGLDGVMKDILLGRYGDATDLSVNTLIPLDPKPLDDSEDTESAHVRIYGSRRIIFWPLYAMGALLGHTNIVVTTLVELGGGGFDVPIGFHLNHDEDMKVYDDHGLPSDLFFWVFQKYSLDMIKCLVSECGFQFRWIDDQYMGMIFDKIFETQDWPQPPWDGDVNEDDLRWECSRERRRLRAESAYKVQMKMLDLLISLGFPFELFFPTEPTIEREEKMHKENKLQTREECKAYEKTLSRDERKANEMAHQACCAYNGLQTTESERLIMGDYWRKLKARWEEGQETAQAAKLAEFEALDSRWRKAQERQNGDNEEDDESEYGSGSSYENPDF